MQNLLKFLIRYSNFLVFLLLEVVAFWIIVANTAYPKSSVLSTANQLIAWNYSTIEEITSYFRLRNENERLALENAALRNQLLSYQSVYEDSLMRRLTLHPEYELKYSPAKVVQMTTSKQHNFLTINKGERDGIQPGMGVRNENGAVGIVSTVGQKYAVVIPLIHTQTNLSCRFLKNDYIATLQWDGYDSRFATLADVAAHMQVNPGDTIITSGLSPVFPIGIPVGTVDQAVLPQGESYYQIRIRLCTNFRRLRFVEVIGNTNTDELKQLEYGLD